MGKALKSLWIIVFWTFYCQTPSLADDSSIWITIGSDTIKTLKNEIKSDWQVYQENRGIAVVKMNSLEMVRLSHLMHEKFGRCGGYFVHDNLDEALKIIEDFKSNSNVNFIDYSITEDDRVVSMIDSLQENKIREVIEKLSSYHNRYYKSQNGIASSNWIKQHWEGLTSGRNDIKVELFSHANFPQPSVILTIEGRKIPEEVVVIGGHADSIAGFWNRNEARAPGADDNASGIATLTEVIRNVVEKGYMPARTIKFMAYAAEEVGLLGSQDIADKFRQKGEKVVGVLQLDMTNQKSGNFDIVLMSDFSDKNQNTFLGQLIDHYVKVPWGYSRCGYGCSDHASWTKNGFPASIPFETTMELSNKKIHTAEDTLQFMGGTANHALKFAKLSAAYMIELAK